MSTTPESVKQLLASEDYGDRLRAVNQIRNLEPPVAFELLKTASEDRNSRVRYAAISQFSTFGKQDRAQALTILRDHLNNDPEPDVQAVAADSLGALQLREAFDDMQRLYHESSEWLVQFSIIATLGELGEPQAFQLLETALNSDVELIQTAAISAFGELGNPQAVSLITPFATSRDWQIRYRVAQALKNLEGADAAPTLETLARDDVEQVAREAKAGLEALKHQNPDWPSS